MRTSTSVALSMCASASERPVVCVQVRLNVIINPKKATNWNPAPAHKNEIYFCNRIVKLRVCHTKSTLHDSSVATRKKVFPFNIQKVCFPLHKQEISYMTLTFEATARQRFCGYIYTYIYYTHIVYTSTSIHIWTHHNLYTHPHIYIYTSIYI
jgi:hypothetical protein